jgi:hypothetical protein
MEKITLFFLGLTFFFSTPTRADILSFIADDKTNEIPYTAEFDCVQFSETLIGEASERGIEARKVFVIWETESGKAYHAFVQFETSDGPVWIEPQNDQEYSIANQGEALCNVNGECVTDKLFMVYLD